MFKTSAHHRHTGESMFDFLLSEGDPDLIKESSYKHRMTKLVLGLAKKKQVAGETVDLGKIVEEVIAKNPRKLRGVADTSAQTLRVDREVILDHVGKRIRDVEQKHGEGTRKLINEIFEGAPALQMGERKGVDLTGAKNYRPYAENKARRLSPTEIKERSMQLRGGKTKRMERRGAKAERRRKGRVAVEERAEREGSKTVVDNVKERLPSTPRAERSERAGSGTSVGAPRAEQGTSVGSPRPERAEREGSKTIVDSVKERLPSTPRAERAERSGSRTSVGSPRPEQGTSVGSPRPEQGTSVGSPRPERAERSGSRTSVGSPRPERAEREGSKTIVDTTRSERPSSSGGGGGGGGLGVLGGGVLGASILGAGVMRGRRRKKRR